jgi:chromosome segregation ATPase
MESEEIFGPERGRSRSRSRIATPESSTTHLYKAAIQERDDLRKWVIQLETQLVGEERRLGTADNAKTLSAIQAQKEAYLQRVQNLELEVIRAENTRSNEFQDLLLNRDGVQHQLNELREQVYGRTGYLTQIQNLQVILELKNITSRDGSSEAVGLEKELLKVMGERDELKAIAEIVGTQIQEVENSIGVLRKEIEGLHEEKRVWQQDKESWELELDKQLVRNAELSLEVRTLEDTVRVREVGANMSDASSDTLTYWREWARKLEEFVRTEPPEVEELYDLAHTYLPRLEENEQYVGVEWVQELINLVSDRPEVQGPPDISSEQPAGVLDIAKRKIDELCEEIGRCKEETRVVMENRDWLGQLLAKEKQLAAQAEELWKDKFEKEVDEAEAHAQEFVEEAGHLQSRLDEAHETIRRLRGGGGGGEEVESLRIDLYNALEECEDVQRELFQATEDYKKLKKEYDLRLETAENQVREAVSLKSDAELRLRVVEEKLAGKGIELQNQKESSVDQYPSVDPPPLNIQVRRAKKKVDMDVQESPKSELSSPEVRTFKRRETDASWVESDASPIESPVVKVRRSGRATRNSDPKHADAEVVPKAKVGRKRKNEVEKGKAEKGSKKKK